MKIEVILLCTIAGVFISYFAFARNRDRDMRTDASESAVIRTKLDSINQGVESIRIDLKANETRLGNLSERITRVEESSKEAHRRIDKMEAAKEEGK